MAHTCQIQKAAGFHHILLLPPQIILSFPSPNYNSTSPACAISQTQSLGFWFVLSTPHFWQKLPQFSVFCDYIWGILVRFHGFGKKHSFYSKQLDRKMSFQDLESGRGNMARRGYVNGKQDPTQAVASGIFQINTAVSTFQRLVNTLGTPKDTPELREKLLVSYLFVILFVFIVWCIKLTSVIFLFVSWIIGLNLKLNGENFVISNWSWYFVSEIMILGLLDFPWLAELARWCCNSGYEFVDKKTCASEIIMRSLSLLM